MRHRLPGSTGVPDTVVLSPETRLLDRANLLRLTAPEMTVLVGGMRADGGRFFPGARPVGCPHPRTALGVMLAPRYNESGGGRRSARTGWRGAKTGFDRENSFR